MSLANLIRGKRVSDQFATATPATFATQRADRGLHVATVATVAVAIPSQPITERHIDPAAASRHQRVLAKLNASPGLRIAVVCDGEGDPVPVAVAIRGKGACEVLIPAARFDPFLLIDFVARHGTTV